MKYADILKPKKTKTKRVYHKDSKYSFMIHINSTLPSC